MIQQLVNEFKGVYMLQKKEKISKESSVSVKSYTGIAS